MGWSAQRRARGDLAGGVGVAHHDLTDGTHVGAERPVPLHLEAGRLDQAGNPVGEALLDADRRSFGHSHGVTLEHRSRRTVRLRTRVTLFFSLATLLASPYGHPPINPALIRAALEYERKLAVHRAGVGLFGFAE